MRIVTVALSAATRCVERNSFVRKVHGFSAHTFFALYAHKFLAMRKEDFFWKQPQKCRTHYYNILAIAKAVPSSIVPGTPWYEYQCLKMRQTTGKVSRLAHFLFTLFHAREWWQQEFRVNVRTESHDSKTGAWRKNRLAIFFLMALSLRRASKNMKILLCFAS